MARTAIEGGCKYTAASAEGTAVDTAGFGKVTLMAAADTAVSVSVGDTSSVGTDAVTSVIDPHTGENATVFPTSGVLSYVGYSRYVKAVGAAILLSEPATADLEE